MIARTQSRLFSGKPMLIGLLCMFVASSGCTTTHLNWLNREHQMTFGGVIKDAELINDHETCLAGFTMDHENLDSAFYPAGMVGVILMP